MENKLNILIMETHPSISATLSDKVRVMGFQPCTSQPEKPIDELEGLRPDLTILGPSLDTKTCLRCIHTLKILDPSIPILASCAEVCPSGESATPFSGIYHLSPDSNPDEISRTIETSLEHKATSEPQPDFQLLVGQSQGVKSAREDIKKVCNKDITVLITGETGTGKELIARSIHYHSSRSKGPMVKINCGALPDELLESEVFGYQRGAFTGAHQDKPGRMEMANGGTLFIDEIGDLSLNLQAKFLQVLEDKAFSRLGGTVDRSIDTRVVAATNSDLEKKMREGTFRKDLFYRLNVVQIKAPSLRGRPDDILLLAHYFLTKYCFEFKKKYLDIPDKIVDLFLAYQWPGNVRELENVIRRAMVLRDWNFIFGELRLANLSHEQERAHLGDDTFLGWDDDKIRRSFRESDFSLKKLSNAYVFEAEQQAILEALRGTQWNRKKAASLLGVSYKTLLNRIAEFDLKP